MFLLKMKTHYRLIKSERKALSRRALFALAGGSLLLLSHLYPGFFKEAAQRFALPFWRLEASLSERVSRFLGSLASKSALETRVRILSQELEEARAALSDRAVLLAENRELKALRKEAGETGGTRALAAILASPPRAPYDTLILDAGREKGVRAGDGVLVGGMELGSITEVFARTSRATLFSSAGVRTPVLIHHHGKATPAEAVGAGGGAFRVILPAGVSVSEGDAVSRPGRSALFAVVLRTERGVTDSFQLVHFKNPVPVGERLFVEILLAPRDEF